MPRTQPPLEDVNRQGSALHPGQFVISAEHASNRIPGSYRDLGLTRRQLDAHIAWDPGTKTIARACAHALGCPCHEGRYSRLLIDLNRSLHHPKLTASQSFSVAIPGNRSVSPAEKDRRIRLYYTPFREAVLADVRRSAERYGRCIHLSIHSFTPNVGRVVRNAEIGLLYDPQRTRERLLADQLHHRLSQQGFHVRRNYPYRGVSDGHVTHLRGLFPQQSYVGLEIEINQRLLKSDKNTRAVARQLVRMLRSLAPGR